jgi:hypothetical protein
MRHRINRERGRLLRVARTVAREAGQDRLDPGFPCVFGHLAERYVSTGACIECRRIKNEGKMVAWRKTERGQALSKAHKERPENREAARDRARAHAAARGGYTPPPLEKDCPPRPTDGRCDCCLRPVTGRGKSGFHLDHDHVTGVFRGWTCSRCNTGRGAIDDPDALRTRADFLEVKQPWQ